MQEIKTDIKRSITNRSFYIPVLAMVITIAIGAGLKQLFPESANQYNEYCTSNCKPYMNI